MTRGRAPPRLELSPASTSAHPTLPLTIYTTCEEPQGVPEKYASASPPR